MRFPAIPSRAALWGWLILVLPAIGLLVATWAVLAPHRISYTVEADRVVVEADAGGLDQGTTFARADVQGAREVQLSGGRRTNGTGLAGYCQGKWRYDGLGGVWQATTCGAEAVAIEVGGAEARTVVVTPADRAGFLAALDRPGVGGTFAPAPAEEEGAIGWVLLLPLVVGGGVLGLVLTKLIRPMVYEVSDGTLTVPAHFAPVRVPLAGATVNVEPMGWAWRAAGSALPGFYLGVFAKGGRRFHAAATDRKEGVFVEGGGKRVYVSPADREAFLAALRREGAR